MAAIIVSELKQKLELLLTYARVRDWTELAAALEVSSSTIRGWIHDNRARAASSVPAARFDRIAALFADLLIGQDPQRVRVLLLGPAKQLDHEIRAAVTPLLSALIDATAIRDGVSIIRRSDETGLVEVEDDNPPELPFMPLGQYFRLVFPALAGFVHALVLQSAGQSWGSVAHIVRDEDGCLLVPAKQGKPVFMRERHHRGLHRFVCLRVRAEPPAAIQDYAKESIALDKLALEKIAFFYGSLSVEDRRCHLLELRIDEAP
jgi:hypothetical protein